MNYPLILIFSTISYSALDVNSFKYFLKAIRESMVAYVEPK